MKSNIFESKVDEGILEWFRRRFTIPSEYSMYVTDKKAHEPYTDEVKFIVYQDQLESGLRFSLDPFVKLFLNKYNIAPGQLHPNSYRILTGYIELMYREGKEPNFDILRHMYSLNKKKGELTFFLAVVSSLNIFARLKDLLKIWRQMYFFYKHPFEFCSIRRLWVDECH